MKQKRFLVCVVVLVTGGLLVMSNLQYFKASNATRESVPSNEARKERTPPIHQERTQNANRDDNKDQAKVTVSKTPAELPVYDVEEKKLKPNPMEKYKGPKKSDTPEKSPSLYPLWWRESWSRSAVSGSLQDFVGDEPLFPACNTNPDKRSTYPFVEPRPYLPNCKNPCWYETPRAKKGLRCVPYVYLAGVAKCGTSDIARRLRMHPEVFYGTQKEYHWWERFRFGSFDEEEPEKTVNVHAGKSFREYLNQITGRDILNLQDELEVQGSSRRIFGDYSPSYFWDPQNWYALDGNQGCPEPRVIVAQHLRHVYPDAKIMMTFRHPTPRLYSRFMSRIHRTPFLKRATTADFHRYVVDGVKTYMKCFDKYSVRRCAYNLTVYKESVVRLVEGMYPVFMADWLRVWPREQMLLMRYEDYGGHEAERLTEIFDFLNLSPLNKTQMDYVMQIGVVNSGSEEYQKYGGMLPETKKVLDDFYQPFVQQFYDLLNDKRFMWQDVYQ
ncbi:carbohydrate sulfotransferase 15-like isoform X2 [Littorina saxatilis]|uniref:Sulfotransferase domain-containing protein n=1 Tax=Littorina saxatilis TaxID=31220 RepID=A0AAN9GEC7_9CAEN